MKNKKYTKIFVFYLVIRIFAIILFAVNIIGAILTDNDSHRSRLIFNSVQSALMVVFSFFPAIIEKTGKVEIPNFMEVIFIIFCICHFVLGEINNFYAKVKIWDSLLHTISSSMFAIIGITLISILNGFERIKVSPLFVAIFSICFTMTVGSLWEILEFTVDSFFDTNMRRFDNSITLEPFIGQKALMDTMKDLILDFCGAFVIAVIGYIDAKRKSNIFKKWQISKIENDSSLEQVAESSIVND